jgi:hypothetical protein
MQAFYPNRLHRLNGLTDFDKQHGISRIILHGCFGLSYSLKAIKKMAELLRTANFPLYLHGIAFDDSLPLERAWCIWLIDYFKAKQFEFVDFKTAMRDRSR